MGWSCDIIVSIWWWTDRRRCNRISVRVMQNFKLKIQNCTFSTIFSLTRKNATTSVLSIPKVNRSKAYSSHTIISLLIPPNSFGKEVSQCCNLPAEEISQGSKIGSQQQPMKMVLRKNTSPSVPSLQEQFCEENDLDSSLWPVYVFYWLWHISLFDRNPSSCSAGL